MHCTCKVFVITGNKEVILGAASSRWQCLIDTLSCDPDDGLNQTRLRRQTSPKQTVMAVRKGRTKRTISKGNITTKVKRKRGRPPKSELAALKVDSRDEPKQKQPKENARASKLRALAILEESDRSNRNKVEEHDRSTRSRDHKRLDNKPVHEVAIKQEVSAGSSEPAVEPDVVFALPESTEYGGEHSPMRDVSADDEPPGAITDDDNDDDYNGDTEIDEGADSSLSENGSSDDNDGNVSLKSSKVTAKPKNQRKQTRKTEKVRNLKKIINIQPDDIEEKYSLPLESLEDDNDTIPNPDAIKCQICAKSYDKLLSFKNHMPCHKLSYYKYIAMVETGGLEELAAEYKSKMAVRIAEKVKKGRTRAQGRKPRIKQHEYDQCKDAVTCFLCQKKYVGIQNLVGHIKRQHPEQQDDPDILKQIDDLKASKAVRMSSVVIECPLCGTSFRGGKVFKHLDQCHSDHHDLDAVIKTCKTSQYHQREHFESAVLSWTTKVKCHLCGKEMRQRYLPNHVRTRCLANPNRTKLHKCNYCSANYVREEDFKKHMITHANRERNYVCDVCGKSYMGRTTLATHKRAVHLIAKNVPIVKYHCDTCGKEFVYKYQYEEHMQRHSGNYFIFVLPLTWRAAQNHLHPL